MIKKFQQGGNKWIPSNIPEEYKPSSMPTGEHVVSPVQVSHSSNPNRHHERLNRRLSRRLNGNNGRTTNNRPTALNNGTHSIEEHFTLGKTPITINNYRPSRYVVDGEESREADLSGVDIERNPTEYNRVHGELLKQMYPEWGSNPMEYIDLLAQFYTKNQRSNLLNKPATEDELDSYYNSYRNFRNTLISIYEKHKGDSKWINDDGSPTNYALSLALLGEHFGAGTSFSKGMRQAGIGVTAALGAAAAPAIVTAVGATGAVPWAAKNIALPYLGGRVVDEGSRLLTGNTWGQNVSNVLLSVGISPEWADPIGELSNPAYWTNYGKLTSSGLRLLELRANRLIIPTDQSQPIFKWNPETGKRYIAGYTNTVKVDPYEYLNYRNRIKNYVNANDIVLDPESVMPDLQKDIFRRAKFPEFNKAGTITYENGQLVYTPEIKSYSWLPDWTPNYVKKMLPINYRNRGFNKKVQEAIDFTNSQTISPLKTVQENFETAMKTQYPNVLMLNVINPLYTSTLENPSFRFNVFRHPVRDDRWWGLYTNYDGNMFISTAKSTPTAYTTAHELRHGLDLGSPRRNIPRAIGISSKKLEYAYPAYSFGYSLRIPLRNSFNGSVERITTNTENKMRFYNKFFNTYGRYPNNSELKTYIDNMDSSDFWNTIRRPKYVNGYMRDYMTGVDELISSGIVDEHQYEEALKHALKYIYKQGGKINEKTN